MKKKNNYKLVPVVTIRVFGGKGCGKTTIINRFVNCFYTEEYKPTDQIELFLYLLWLILVKIKI